VHAVAESAGPPLASVVQAPAALVRHVSFKRRALRGIAVVLPAPVGRAARGLVGSVVSVRTTEPLVALTFDDGPDPVWTPKILDALDAHGARATFFVLAHRAEELAGLVREIRERGHEVGHHGDDHTRLHGASRAEVHRCIVAGRRRLERVLGGPVQLFRPPYGSLTPYAYAVARAHRLRIILWSANARDASDAPVDALVANALGTLAPGGIVLLHDRLDLGTATPPGSALDRAAVVESLLQATGERGWRSVTVSELLASGSPSHVVRFMR
jgi:peptidoglycan/xylan/chitin deacetylase (PgdA/CDA1 family)